MRIYLNQLICPGRRNSIPCMVMFLIGISLSNAAFGSTGPDTGGAGAYQQPMVTVGGVVTDEGGNLLPGVTVISAGQNIGTVTDGQGRYSITVPEGTVLTFSFLGYTSQTQTARGTVINVTMVSDAIEIDQVVMVGYGQQKKVTMTGSVASIRTDEIKQSAAANLGVALAGRLPGLTTLQTSGQPGRDDVTMYLRGMGTINGADPLIMIDGVPRSEISTLDPNEVESISILKDASATAVFGVRGANGVILITTRRGRVGKPELNVSFDQSWQTFTRRPDRIHSWEYAELRNQAMRNDGTPEENLSYTSWMIERYRSGDDPVFFPDRNLYKEVIRDWAPQSRVNVNMHGGTNKIRYFMNVGYLHQGGNIKTEPKDVLGYDPAYKLDRYTFRANVDYDIARRLTLMINLGSYLEKMNMPSAYHWINETPESGYNNVVSSTLMAIWGCTPGTPGPLTTEGYGVPGGGILNEGNYYGTVNERGYHRATRTNLNSTVGLNYDLGFLTEGLSTKLMISYDNQSISDLDTYRTHFNLYDYVLAREEGEQSYFYAIEDNASASLSMNKNYRSKYYYNLQYSVDYARSFGRHDVSALALFQRDNWDQWGGDIPYNLVSLAGRVTYAYDYKYLAEFNFGYNGSEQFSDKRRFGFFPAVSVGWVVSNEDFLKDNRVITNMKLRVTYGEVGNDKMGGSRFMYLDNFALGEGYVPGLGRGQQVNQYYNGNRDLTWEKARKQNYGMDLRLFRDISLTFDYFIEKRRDILSKSQIPDLQGIPSGAQPNVNLAKVNNRGYEIELDYFKPIRSDLSIHVKGNFAYNRNKLIYNDEPILPATYTYRLRGEGYPLGQQWGYIRDMSNGNGYINTQDELNWATNAYRIGTPRLGDFKYVDTNNDGVIDEKDEVPIGYGGIPRITYGISLVLNWKGLDFSVLFQGMGKYSGYFAGLGVFDSSSPYTGYHMRAWTPERYANGEKISYPALSTTSGVSSLRNDFFIMDRSFLRLKNIEVGYTMPRKWFGQKGISNIRVYLSGQNVWAWDKLRFNSFDPEMNSGSSYPITSMINVGANVTF